MLNITILAAGKGTRMKSRLPKVLHLLGGKPMINHVLDKALSLKPHSINLVIGHESEQLRTHIHLHYPASKTGTPIHIVLQEEQLGTAHAVLQCSESINAFTLACTQTKQNGRILILYGDVPLVCLETLEQVIQQSKNVVVTADLNHPFGYGRIIRHKENGSNVLKIVEQKDLTAEQEVIQEINTGVLCVNITHLLETLSHIGKSNSGEYYLTDLIEAFSHNEMSFLAHKSDHFYPFAGVNDPVQLAEMEQYFQRTQTHQLMKMGVRLQDPNRVVIRGDLSEMTFGQDVFLDVGVVLTGKVQLADGVSVGAYTMIEDASIEADATIHPYSHICNSTVGSCAVIGPYARIRPGSTISESAHIGNFVEVKNSVVGKGSKANHLAYVGDADIGERVNVGAGTITCNYDGAYKHRTVIEDDVFIGSDSQLVAPVRIGKGATLGAGTTLTKDAPEEALTISRTKQTSIKNWKRPTKK